MLEMSHCGGICFWCEDMVCFRSSHTSDTQDNYGKIKFYYNLPEQQYGWICPKCNSVMAPFQDHCIVCKSEIHPYTSPETTAGCTIKDTIEKQEIDLKGE